MEYCRQKIYTSQELKHILKIHGAYSNMYLSRLNTDLIIIENVQTQEWRGILHELEPVVDYR